MLLVSRHLNAHVAKLSVLVSLVSLSTFIFPCTGSRSTKIAGTLHERYLCPKNCLSWRRVYSELTLSGAQYRTLLIHIVIPNRKKLPRNALSAPFSRFP